MEISVIGCGWLGEPLAVELIANGHLVKGSTTSPGKIERLCSKNIEAYLGAFNPDFEGDASIFNAEVLVINIPPKARSLGQDFHLTQIQNLIEQLKVNKVDRKIIFVSSTSVYANNNCVVSEENADLNNFLVKAENMLFDFAKSNDSEITVVRFGGLMGYERNPCKYFDGKSGLTNGDTPVNYIHLDDAVAAICSIIEKGLWNKTYNICSPKHPSRSEILTGRCEKYGYVSPVFETDSEKEDFKMVSVEKFLSDSHFVFIYADPLDFKYLSKSEA